ncbi:MAG: type II secretion system protein [Trueperaceae bacterium]
MRPTSRSLGMTLLEMLLACTLLGVLLLTATGVQVQARKASTVSEEVAFHAQIVELASELLRYHLGLAGHRGLGAPGNLQGPGLALARGSGGSDAFAVRYLEERWYAQPELRALRFDVRRDSTGRWNLYQQEEGATRQPAVQHVNGLELTGIIALDGAELSADASLPVDAVAIELNLRFSWGESRTLMVSFPTPVRVVEETP